MKTRLFAVLLAGFCSLTQAAPGTGPAKLVITEVKAGTGKEAKAGNTATVHYSGWIFDTKADKQHGAMFDSSVGKSPFSFSLGASRVIKGWDVGVAGMKVGGKRTLIIPADMAYGSRGAGNVIPPDTALIFDVELLDVK